VKSSLDNAEVRRFIYSAFVTWMCSRPEVLYTWTLPLVSPVKTTGRFLANLSAVFGVSILFPSESMSKWQITGAKLFIFKSQISTRPSLATLPKTDEVFGLQLISLTCCLRISSPSVDRQISFSFGYLVLQILTVQSYEQVANMGFSFSSQNGLHLIL